MQEKEYIATIEGILVGIKPILDDTRKCIMGHDEKCLESAEKKRKVIIQASLPLTEEIIGRKEKSDLDKKYIALLPSLQRLAISVDDLLTASRRKIRTDTFFTEKALNEIQEIIRGVEDMARDAKDLLSTRNPRLMVQVPADLERIRKLADDYALIHQERLIVGLCSPKASYLYLDILDSTKRIAKELAFIAERA